MRRPATASRTAAILLLAGTAALTGCFASRNASSPRSSKARLAVPSEDLHVGEIWATADYHRVLHVKNVSREPVEGAEFVTSCGCASVAPRRADFEPGQTRRITLSLDLSKGLDQATLGDRRDFSIVVGAILPGDHKPSALWRVKGAARKLLDVSQSVVRFDRPLVRGDPFPWGSVTATAAVPLASLKARVREKLVVADVIRESDSVYLIRLRPREDAPLGAFRCDVELAARRIDEEEEVGPIAVVRVVGRVTGRVVASPDAVEWGVVRLGETMESRVAIRSLGGEPFTITSIEAPSAGTAASAEDREGGIRTLVIRQTARAVGRQELWVAANVEMAGGHTDRVEIPVCYYGARWSSSGQQ